MRCLLPHVACVRTVSFRVHEGGQNIFRTRSGCTTDLLWPMPRPNLSPGSSSNPTFPRGAGEFNFSEAGQGRSPLYAASGYTGGGGHAAATSQSHDAVGVFHRRPARFSRTGWRFLRRFVYERSQERAHRLSEKCALRRKRKIPQTDLRSRIPSESSQDFPRFCLFKIPSQALRC